MPGRKFKDDRGTARRAMGMREAELARKRRGLTRLEVGNSVWLNKSRHERAEPLRVVGLLIAIVGVLCLLLFGANQWAQVDPVVGAVVFWGFAAGFLLMPLLPPVILGWMAIREFGRRPEAMLRYHVCACCGYDLRGAAAEEDGCTVCPECGAAYDMSVRAAPLGRTLRPVWWIVPWFDDRWRHIRQWGRLDPNAPREAKETFANLGFVRRPFWWTLVVFLFAGLLVVVFLLVGIDEEGPLAAALMTLVFGGAYLQFVLGNRRLRRHGYCPACYESLRNVEPEADGCTVCPECGAAWKLPAETDDRAAASSEVA